MWKAKAGYTIAGLVFLLGISSWQIYERIPGFKYPAEEEPRIRAKLLDGTIDENTSKTEILAQFHTARIKENNDHSTFLFGVPGFSFINVVFRGEEMIYASWQKDVGGDVVFLNEITTDDVDQLKPIW